MSIFVGHGVEARGEGIRIGGAEIKNQEASHFIILSCLVNLVNSLELCAINIDIIEY